MNGMLTNKWVLALCFVAPLTAGVYGDEADPEALSESEIYFAVVDTDEDGRVSREEFLQDRTSRIATKMETLDKDGDQQVSIAEWKARKGEKKGAMKAFKRADRNGDNFIVPAEIQRIVMGKAPKDYKALDKDKDGYLSEQELARMLTADDTDK